MRDPNPAVKSEAQEEFGGEKEVEAHTADILKDLNPSQKEAVTHPLGPLLVVAGPGSGKTRVITHRVAWLLRQGVPAERMLAVTFTKRAAEEMRRRVADLTGQSSEAVWLGTFHAECARILHEAGRRFTIYDRDDQGKIIRQALKRVLGAERAQMVKARPVIDVISACKVNGFTSDELAKMVTDEDFHPGGGYEGARRRLRKTAHFDFESMIQPVYAEYEEAMRAAGALDFDDLLLETVKFLRGDRRAALRYADRFLHVLVDEFQDVNAIQYELVCLLGGMHGNITVVGDPDQAIYAWRGADRRIMQRFENDFLHHKLVLLEQNYRSMQTILDIADAVIRDNPGHYERKLWTERGKGEKAELFTGDEAWDEGKFVATEVKRLISEEGHAARDCAVLFRTNAQSRVFESALFEEGIPYRVMRRPPFFDRAVVRDVLVYLRLAVNPRDTVAFSRAVNTPRRGVGPKSQAMLLTWANERGMPPGDAVRDAVRGLLPTGLQARAADGVRAFAGVMAGLSAKMGSAADAVSQVIEAAEFEAYVAASGAGEYQDAMDNLRQLEAAALEHDRSGRTAPGVEGFLEEIALMADADSRDPQVDAVSLGTFHAAKGLEFRAVFLTGIADGILPHRRSLEDEEMAGEEVSGHGEEQRLFFGGITRAKDRLYLSYHRMTNWEILEPSRFLKLVPRDCLKTKKARADKRQKAWCRMAPARNPRGGGMTMTDQEREAARAELWLEEKMGIGRTAPPDARPSQTRDQYWLYAYRNGVKATNAMNNAGKWLLFVPVDDIDRWWELIRTATEEGRLGPASKTSTAKPNPNAADQDTKVICVYTENAEDEADVMRVREELRRLGIKWDLCYKTDEATRAGKYAVRGSRNICKYRA
jgi:DNA helicase-2/ATP-dependent DNA helicase PcrA